MLDRRCCLIRFLGTAVLCLCLYATVQADPRDPQLATATARELWRQGSSQIMAGEFDAARGTLEKIDRLEPGNSEVSSVLAWMKQAQELSASRARYRQAMYDYYVDQVRKAVKEAKSPTTAPAEKKTKTTKKDKKSQDDEAPDEQRFKWSKALAYAQTAMGYSASEDDFRKEPWLEEVVANVLKEIERHQQANEWRDALFLYDLLKQLYPDEKQYAEGYTFCAKRAHLDFVYGPKSTWRTDLRDVRPNVIGQILDRIEDDYVEVPDMKKLARAGLEHLMILAKAESLVKAFPTLGDHDLVRNFTHRIEGLLKRRVDEKDRLSAREVRDLFGRVLEANKESLRLPDSVLVDEFVSGLLEPLDEFTSVIWPSEVDDFNKHTRGEFVGVGIQITQDFGKHVRVESPLEDSPAYRAGIKPGDFITHVDGKSTLDLNINQAVNLITGQPKTKVVLTILDPTTQQSREVPLLREQITIRTVRGNQRDSTRPTGWDYMIDRDHKVAYIRVSGFMDKTVDDMEAALRQLREEGARGLILDLRFNPGGLLTSAVRMSELFLAHDDPIVQTKGRNRQQNMEILSKSEADSTRMAIIVLVNEYSASASEIVAGALAGLNEACVLGVRTFGKGSVQNLIPIADNRAYLKLTTAYYHVPDKSSPDNPWYLLHRKPGSKTWGVEPHVEVKLTQVEQVKALRLRRERDLLKGKDQSAIPKDVLERRPTTSQPDEPLPEDPNADVDPQIDAAMNILRMKLMNDLPWTLASREQRTLSRAEGVSKTETVAR